MDYNHKSHRHHSSHDHYQHHHHQYNHDNHHQYNHHHNDHTEEHLGRVKAVSLGERCGSSHSHTQDTCILYIVYTCILYIVYTCIQIHIYTYTILLESHSNVHDIGLVAQQLIALGSLHCTCAQCIAQHRSHAV